MVALVFVVSRAHAWVYRHLVERFHDDTNVQVILDRRIAERRREQATTKYPAERRKSERRRAVGPEEDLRIHSHYIVEP